MGWILWHGFFAGKNSSKAAAKIDDFLSFFWLEGKNEESDEQKYSFRRPFHPFPTIITGVRRRIMTSW